MAIIKCPDCNNEVSTEANKCIHCGCPIKKKRNSLRIMVIIMMILLIGILICFFYSMFISDFKKEDSYYINKFEKEIQRKRDDVSNMNCYVTTLTDERIKVTCSYKYKATYYDINYCSYGNVIRHSCSRIVEKTESTIYNADE